MSLHCRTASLDGHHPSGELASRIDELRDQVSHSDERSQQLLRDTIAAITEFNRQDWSGWCT